MVKKIFFIWYDIFNFLLLWAPTYHIAQGPARPCRSATAVGCFDGTNFLCGTNILQLFRRAPRQCLWGNSYLVIYCWIIASSYPIKKCETQGIWEILLHRCPVRFEEGHILFPVSRDMIMVPERVTLHDKY